MSFDREKHIVSRRRFFTERYRQRVEQISCAGTDFPVFGFLSAILIGGITGAAGLGNERRRLMFALGGSIAGFVAGTIFENKLFENHPKTSRYC